MITTYGYCSVTLFKDNNSKTYLTHRIIANIFLKKNKNKKDINHKNGIKTANSVKNIEWCSPSQNMIHSYKILNRVNAQKGKFGKLNHSSKKILQYEITGKFIKEWDSMHDVKRGLGISPSKICLTCKGERKKAGGYIWKYK